MGARGDYCEVETWARDATETRTLPGGGQEPRRPSDRLPQPLTA